MHTLAPRSLHVWVSLTGVDMIESMKYAEEKDEPIKLDDLHANQTNTPTNQVQCFNG
jgi:hypothetical protein